MAKAELFQKDIPKDERVFYYASEEDDPIKTDEQEKKVDVGLPKNYEFIPKNIFVKMYSALLFRIFKLFGQYYERGYWQVKFYGREKLKKARGKGYVIYANHTNPFHDVFGPADFQRLHPGQRQSFAGSRKTGDFPAYPPSLSPE